MTFDPEQAQSELLTLWNSHQATAKANKVQMGFRQIPHGLFAYEMTLTYIDGQSFRVDIEQCPDILSEQEQYRHAMLMLRQRFAEFDATRKEQEFEK